MGSSMLKQTSAWLLSLLVIAMLPLLAPAQTPAPSPGPDCNTALFTLYPCLDYVMGNASTPPKNCCVALSQVVDNTPLCLCSLFQANNSFGITINVTDALHLPSACKVSTPPPSACTAAGYPVPASLTAPAPAVPPPVTPSSAPSSVPSTSPAPASSLASAPGPTTASTSPTTVSSPGGPGSSAPSGATTPSASTTSPPPPSTPAPSPSAAGELSVSTAMCFVALLVATLQRMKL